jgi:hypothetical protein
MIGILNRKKDKSTEEQIEEIKCLPDILQRSLLEGESCDYLSNVEGEFGRSPRNPIPVNGPFGEIRYLNSLRTISDVGLIYHRIGSIEVESIKGNVDIFETVSLDNRVWDILFFHMYHPRRSTNTPSSYKKADYDKYFSILPIGFGVTSRDNSFPYGIPKRLIESKEFGSMSEKLAKHLQDSFLNKHDFIRPDDHKRILAEIILKYINKSKDQYRSYTTSEYKELADDAAGKIINPGERTSFQVIFRPKGKSLRN